MWIFYFVLSKRSLTFVTAYIPFGEEKKKMSP